MRTIDDLARHYRERADYLRDCLDKFQRNGGRVLSGAEDITDQAREVVERAIRSQEDAIAYLEGKGAPKVQKP
jgi:methyl-accepting chemotaxis protein